MTTSTLNSLLDERQRLDQLIHDEQESRARRHALQEALSKHGCHVRKRKGVKELVILYPYWNGYRSMAAPALDEDRFRGDPSGYLAAHFNVSRQQYLDWHASKYRIRCSGYTEAAIPCRAMVRGPYSGSPELWVAMHGKVFCHFHDPNGSYQRRKREAQRRAEVEAPKPRLGGISAVARTLGLPRHRLAKIRQASELSVPFPQPHPFLHTTEYRTEGDERHLEKVSLWDLDELSIWWQQLREDERSRLLRLTGTH